MRQSPSCYIVLKPGLGVNLRQGSGHGLGGLVNPIDLIFFKKNQSNLGLTKFLFKKSQ
jgi:hypothetical protein